MPDARPDARPDGHDAHARLATALAGRYALGRELGAGGMATVYLAHDLRHDRPVAVKVLRPDLAAALGPERFQREIRVAARLQHPHILTVLDSGEAADGRLWFTMPYVEGESLRAKLTRERQLSVPDAVRIAREVARALDYAHQHGVIHRDIKPENLLLTGDGSTLVADFGVARVLAGGEVGEGDGGDPEFLTGTGVTLGTPGYMSPEQLSAEPALDGRTDVFSLGVVLYEMLVGETPFAGPTPQVIAARTLRGEVPSACQTRPSLSTEVDAVVRTALAPLPADRFADAGELAAALERAERAERTAVGPTAPLSSKAERAPVPATTLALLLGLLVGGGALFAWGSRPTDRPAARRSADSVADGVPGAPASARLAVLPFENLGVAGDAYFADGMSDAVRGQLQQIRALTVIGERSSARYKGTTKTSREVGRELGVDYLLTGRVLWNGRAGAASRVRISPELVAVADEATRWQASFETPVADVFAVQADIARRAAIAIAEALGSGRGGDVAEGARRLQPGPQTTVEAYALYLKGASAARAYHADSARVAAALVRRAIAADSTYAPAYAVLSQALVSLSHGDATLFGAGQRDAALAAAREAVRRDSLSAMAHVAMARVENTVTWDFTAADASFRRALALDPSSAWAATWYAQFLTNMGRFDEAVAMGRRSARLDPFVGADSYLAPLHALGRDDELLRDAAAFLAVDSLSLQVNMRGYMAPALARRGLSDSAVKMYRRSWQLRGVPPDDPVFGWLLARVGRRAEARRVLASALQRNGADPRPGHIAAAYAQLGEVDSALVWLRRAVDARDGMLTRDMRAILLAPLRSDPRYRAMMKEVGLPP